MAAIGMAAVSVGLACGASCAKQAVSLSEYYASMAGDFRTRTHATAHVSHPCNMARGALCDD
jgi:hypothetical protein